jgi:hypothetical protein
MNCKHVQELLPLYVGRDLEETRAQMITAHVQSCAECAGAVDEYRETRQLLQQFAPPQFSEAVYAEIRQSVLSEIASEATVPGLSRWLESLFRPRLRWAVAMVLLLAFSVFAFYFIASRSANQTNSQQQVAGNSRTPDGTSWKGQPISQGSAVSSEGFEKGERRRNTGAGTTIAGSVDRARRFQRRRSFGAPVEPTSTVAVNTSASMSAEASPEDINLSAPDAAPAGESATSEKTLRVEMQTKDPNVRIIWFAHEPTKQDSRSKFSKAL